jgi:hypothetical protein
VSSPDVNGVEAAVDNDVLIKAACYRLHDAIVESNFGVLGAARFVIRSRIARMSLTGDRELAQRAAADLIARSVVLEPTPEELALAAEVETLAQREGLELDAGESQLATIVAERRLPQLKTGDKRAIRALEQLLDVIPRLSTLMGRVRCLEQLIEDLVERLDPDDVARAICAEPTVDKTLAICARCYTPSPHGPAIDREGLSSYIGQVRAAAPRLLQG